MDKSYRKIEEEREEEQEQGRQQVRNSSRPNTLRFLSQKPEDEAR